MKQRGSWYIGDESRKSPPNTSRKWFKGYAYFWLMMQCFQYSHNIPLDAIEWNSTGIQWEEWWSDDREGKDDTVGEGIGLVSVYLMPMIDGRRKVWWVGRISGWSNWLNCCNPRSSVIYLVNIVYFHFQCPTREIKKRIQESVMNETTHSSCHFWGISQQCMRWEGKIKAHLSAITAF